MNMEGSNIPGTNAYYEPARNAPDPAYQKAAPERKGFPFFGIPAIAMLTLMLIVFGLEIFISLHKNNILRLFDSPFTGMQNFERYLSSRNFMEGLRGTLLFRGVQICAGGILAAALSALYYAFRKPRAVLTFACLWLIPACLPYYTMSLAFLLPAVHAGDSGVLLYLLTSVLQTTSIFCFFGGLFTYMNLLKKGQAGGGPYYGLLIAVLVWMLGAMSANAMYNGGMTQLMRDTSLDMVNFRMVARSNQYSVGAAGGVIKVVLQVVSAVVPIVILSILGRKKSTLGKTPLATVWVFLAVPAGVILLLISGMFSLDRLSSAVLQSVITVLIGGGFGGLIAYSFIHLLRRVPSFVFALIAVVLAASLSCMAAQTVFMNNLTLRDTVWPQALLAAFDGRLVLIITALAFALRNHKEARPGSLVVAVALLAGAFVWGEVNVASLHSMRTMPVSIYTMNVMNNAMSQSSLDTASAAVQADRMNLVNTQRTIAQLILAIPPLLLGIGASLMMKRSLSIPDGTLRG